MIEQTNKDKIIDEIVLLKLRHPLSVEDKLKLQKLQQKIIKEILDPYKFDYYIPVHNTGTMYVTDNELF